MKDQIIKKFLMISFIRGLSVDDIAEITPNLSLSQIMEVQDEFLSRFGLYFDPDLPD